VVFFLTSVGALVGTAQVPSAKPKLPKDPNAPKRPRGRPRKDGTIPKQHTQGSESDSSSESDLSVEEEPEKLPALLSVQMPTDERGKAMFQAVQAVWSPRNLTAPVEKIKAGIAQFGDTIRSLRDSWKSKNESLKKAELPNSATAANATLLKADVAHYRQIVETVVNRSIQLAHPAILKRYVSPISPSPIMDFNLEIAVQVHLCNTLSADESGTQECSRTNYVCMGRYFGLSDKLDLLDSIYISFLGLMRDRCYKSFRLKFFDSLR
jgi:hypothetical protein